jgi:hypothetical protein
MASEELKIGDKAPSFNMPTDDGGTVSLSSPAGSNVVLCDLALELGGVVDLASLYYCMAARADLR